jgi:hypothetical protein
MPDSYQGIALQFAEKPVEGAGVLKGHGFQPCRKSVRGKGRRG